MAIRKIARMGHPVLRKLAREIPVEEIRNPPVQGLIDDLIETMKEYQGLGIAAPQVHESVRLTVIELPQKSARYPGTLSSPLFILINPKIVPLTEEEEGHWEGCLSVPGIRGFVERPRKIRVDFFDRDAHPQSIEAEGFLATVFQHECDHLDGRLFIDRIADPLKLSFIEEFRRFHLPREEN